MNVLGSVPEPVLLATAQRGYQDIQARGYSVWCPKVAISSHVPAQLIEEHLCGAS